VNVLPRCRKIAILNALTEGNSIRSIERMTGSHRDTIMRLLRSTGDNFQELLDERMRDIPAKEIQCVEIWCFVGKQDKRLTIDDGQDKGSQFIFVAMDPDTKLVPCFAIGKRTLATATGFMVILASRLQSRIQLTTDEFRPYLKAVYTAFGVDVDYGVLSMRYNGNNGGREGYALSNFRRSAPVRIFGHPDSDRISTSYIERQNLTMRMQMRRLTRCTNAFSKKRENIQAALALHFAWYNFVRVHQTLKVTPAMEAGISDHVWDMMELIK
jgi:IS1 family transposase